MKPTERLTQKLTIAREGLLRFSVAIGNATSPAINLMDALAPECAEALYHTALMHPEQITPEDWTAMCELAEWAQRNNHPILAQKMHDAALKTIDNIQLPDWDND